MERNIIQVFLLTLLSVSITSHSAWPGARVAAIREGRIAYVDNPQDGEIRDYFDAYSPEEIDGQKDSMALNEAGDSWE
jgi:hypothetical protein